MYGFPCWDRPCTAQMAGPYRLETPACLAQRHLPSQKTPPVVELRSITGQSLRPLPGSFGALCSRNSLSPRPRWWSYARPPANRCDPYRGHLANRNYVIVTFTAAGGRARLDHRLIAVTPTGVISHFDSDGCPEFLKAVKMITGFQVRCDLVYTAFVLVWAGPRWVHKQTVLQR